MAMQPSSALVRTMWVMYGMFLVLDLWRATHPSRRRMRADLGAAVALPEFPWSALAAVLLSAFVATFLHVWYDTDADATDLESDTVVSDRFKRHDLASFGKLALVIVARFVFIYLARAFTIAMMEPGDTIQTVLDGIVYTNLFFIATLDFVALVYALNAFLDVADTPNAYLAPVFSLRADGMALPPILLDVSAAFLVHCLCYPRVGKYAVDVRGEFLPSLAGAAVGVGAALNVVCWALTRTARRASDACCYRRRPYTQVDGDASAGVAEAEADGGKRE